MSQNLKPLRVHDLWQALQGLPDDAPVLITELEGEWGGQEREITFAHPATDGRYGRCMQLHIGGFAKPWPDE